MKFSEIPYARPDVEEYKKSYADKIERFKQAATSEEQIELWREISLQQIEFSTNPTLVMIRNSIDTKDKFYNWEQKYWDELGPTLEDLSKQFRRAVLTSEYRNELIEVFGMHVFSLYELQEKTFSPIIVEDMQKENKLVSEYVDLVWWAEFPFAWEEQNLSKINKFLSVWDRDLRKQAVDAKFERYAKNDINLNNMYDNMVQLRHRMAKKLGYENFIEYRYDNLLRVDYDAEAVKEFRNAVIKSIVPVCTQLYEQQAKYIWIDTLYYHDEAVSFPEWNPKPTWTSTEILEKAKQMYHELAPETKEFIDFMFSHETFDVETKKGKSTWGYCTTIDAYKLPFIFSNFNGTTADIDVLTHEVGHAFQAYLSMREQPLQDYYWPTSETAEIHSMSMEYLTMPWMKNFFNDEKETLKYEYLHLVQALTFAPYWCAVDEFQEIVFMQAEHPTKTYEEIWLEMEKKYLPHRQYLDNAYLQKGNFWKQKLHIFKYPLYYIDYVLAQMCALQFRMRSEKDFTKTRSDYLKLCKLWGSKSFLSLLKEVQLESPFDPTTIEKTTNYVKERLEKHTP